MEEDRKRIYTPGHRQTVDEETVRDTIKSREAFLDLVQSKLDGQDDQAKMAIIFSHFFNERKIYAIVFLDRGLGAMAGEVNDEEDGRHFIAVGLHPQFHVQLESDKAKGLDETAVIALEAARDAALSAYEIENSGGVFMSPEESRTYLLRKFS